MVSSDAQGERRRRTVAWYEMPGVCCELCGRPLGRSIWVAPVGGRERVFCGADCELLARTRTAAGDG
jgi:hypothetical protein